MKFPVPRSVYSPLELTPEIVDSIEGKADAVLNETLLTATRLLESENGRVNEHAWKKIKKFDDNVTLYRERHAGLMGGRPRQASVGSSMFSGSPPPSFLVVGQLACGLDDLMYGLSVSSGEDQRIRSSYSPDGIIDCQLLEHIHKPNKQSPFHHLNLQWLVMEPGNLPLVQPRDYVVVDGAGVVNDPHTRSRISYWMRHSVDLDETQPLTHLKVVRGAMGVCGIFHEISSSMVHVYMRMTFEPHAATGISKSIATSAAMGHAAALMQILQSSQMKKLALAVRQSELQSKQSSPMEASDDYVDPLGSSYGSNATSVASSYRSTVSTSKKSKRKGDACESCQRIVGVSTVEEIQEASCGLCSRLLCRPCRIRKELSFVGRYNRIHRSKMGFCSDCISHAIHRDAQRAAIEELSMCEHNKPASTRVATRMTTMELDAMDPSPFAHERNPTSRVW